MTDDTKKIVLRNLLDLDRLPQEIPWQHFRDGIEIYPLYTNDEGCSAALLRYTSNAKLPAHMHTGYEHILVLDGAQADEEGRYDRGTLMISPPGSSHTITSEAGCIVLAIWEKPVRFL